MKNSKILVTGMSGLIGGIAGRKFAVNHDVSALGRSNVEGFPTSIVDIGDGIDGILPALEGVKTVIHMAGSRGNVPAETHIKANVTGVYNLFEACRIAGVKRIVAASTGAVIAGYEKDEPYKSLVHDPDFEMPAQRPNITVETPSTSQHVRRIQNVHRKLRSDVFRAARHVDNLYKDRKSRNRRRAFECPQCFSLV